MTASENSVGAVDAATLKEAVVRFAGGKGSGRNFAGIGEQRRAREISPLRE